MKTKLILSVFGLVIASHAHAVVFCVSSEQDLTDALAVITATQVASSDEIHIKVRANPYVVPNGGWQGTVNGNNSLVIRGGYTDATCLVRVIAPPLTVLDGNNANRPLTITTPDFGSGTIEVSGLTIRNGRAADTGGLKVGDPVPIHFGGILIEHNIFMSNVATQNSDFVAGALQASTDGPDWTGTGTALFVRNNLFVDNTAPNAAAAFVFSNNYIDISNNTFFNNQSTDNALSKRVAMGFFTFAGAHFSNNIFWGNNPNSLANTFDLNFSGFGQGTVGAILVNNNIEASTGTAVTNTNTTANDPQFADSINGDLHLKYISPLINQGTNNPAGGVSSVDLDGAPRIDNDTLGFIDLGAYESNYVFVDGFDSNSF